MSSSKAVLGAAGGGFLHSVNSSVYPRLASQLQSVQQLKGAGVGQWDTYTEEAQTRSQGTSGGVHRVFWAWEGLESECPQYDVTPWRTTEPIAAPSRAREHSWDGGGGQDGKLHQEGGERLACVHHRRDQRFCRVQGELVEIKLQGWDRAVAVLGCQQIGSHIRGRESEPEIGGDQRVWQGSWRKRRGVEQRLAGGKSITLNTRCCHCGATVQRCPPRAARPTSENFYSLRFFPSWGSEPQWVVGKCTCNDTLSIL